MPVPSLSPRPWIAFGAALVCAGWAMSAWAAGDAEVLAAERRRVETIRRASAAAVSIFAGAAGGGSGVLVSPDGYALSNFHVTQPAGLVMKCGLDDGRLYDAVLVGLDPTGDATSASRPAIRSFWPPTCGRRSAWASCPGCIAISSPPARSSNTPTASRWMPPSIPATLAAACSMRPAG